MKKGECRFLKKLAAVLDLLKTQNLSGGEALWSPHCWVLGPEMHMFKKEVILYTSSFSAAKGRGSGEISGSRPLIRLLI